MAFRLLNIGDGRRIIPPSDVTVIDGYTYSNTGKAFTGAVSSSSSYTYYFFTLPSYIAEDIWIGFDLYLNSTSSSSGYFYLGYWARKDAFDSKNASYIEGLYLRSGIMRLNMERNYSSTTAQGTLKKQALNKIICHMHNESGTNASYGELTINGVTTRQAVTRDDSYNVAIGAEVDALKTVAIAFPRDYPCYVSNLIISDTEISPKELVIELPIGSTSTTMMAGLSGSYIADTVGQTLLHTPAVSALIASYGASSQVTGIAVVGNPAYNLTSGVSELIGVSKAGGSIIEHGAYNLSTDTIASVMDSWSIENTAIADLQNMQFGWKVGM